jgi:hypothetical protein
MPRASTGSHVVGTREPAGHDPAMAHEIGAALPRGQYEPSGQRSCRLGDGQ